jgi:hypothetical protein
LNFTEILNSQGDPELEAVPEETSTDLTTANEEIFIEPPKRVGADNKNKKKAINKSATSQASAEVEVSIICRFYMRGSCKFGFFGKGKAGQGRCPFSHPKPCKKLMDNGAGEGGCTKGRDCEAAHPRMCHQSLTSRSCINIKDGGRCSAGYHVHGTKAPAVRPIGSSTTNPKGSRGSYNKVVPINNKKNDSSNQTWTASSSPLMSQDRRSAPTTGTPSLGEQQLDLSSVFGELIRAEVVKLLQTGTLWPQRTSQQCGQAASPPVSPPVLKGQDTTITMGNLGALLSLLGNHQQQ